MAKTRSIAFHPDKVLQELKYKEISSRYTNNITTRYKGSKRLIDNHLSLYFAKSLSDINNSVDLHYVKRNYYTLSRFFEVLFNLKRVPLKDQLKYLGYDIQDIKRTLKEISEKKLKICLVGYGGANLNIIENIVELINITKATSQKNPLFRHITVYDGDDIEFHNIPRFSTSTLFEVNGVDTIDKVDLFTILNSELLTYDYGVRYHYLNDDDLKEFEYDLVIGTPDIPTRNKLSKFENFLCPTHQGNTVALLANPIIQEEVVNETYAKINLVTFFLNMLRVTVKILFSINKKEYLLGDTVLLNHTECLNNFKYRV